eukprot:m.16268 g.16268  ORF g.16268 m.16268 type:complete len:459 (-) comp4592_c0_seq1:552-1928(-)
MTPAVEELLLYNSLALPVSTILCDSFASLMVVSRKYLPRLKLIEWLLINLLGNEQSSKRILFIHLCSKVPMYFSRAFFKEYLFLPMLSLAEDTVLDVRRHLSDFIITMKKMLVLPKDHNLHRKLEAAVTQLEDGMYDDEDWLETLSELNNKLEDIDIPITWDSSFVFDDHHIDQQREEDEQCIAKQGEQCNDSSRSPSKSSRTSKEVSKIKKFLALPQQPGNVNRSRSHSPRRRSSDLKSTSQVESRNNRKEKRRSSLFKNAVPTSLQHQHKLPSVHREPSSQSSSPPSQPNSSPSLALSSSSSPSHHTFSKMMSRFKTPSDLKFSPQQERKQRMRQMLSSQSQPNISSMSPNHTLSPSPLVSPSSAKYLMQVRRRSNSTLDKYTNFDQMNQLSRPKMTKRCASQNALDGNMCHLNSSLTSSSTSHSEPSNGFLSRQNSSKSSLRKLPQLTRQHKPLG